MHQFTYKDDVVSNLSALNKSILKECEEIENRLKSFCQYFGNDFVSHVIETNGSKLFYSGGFGTLGDQSDQSSIKLLEKMTPAEKA